MKRILTLLIVILLLSGCGNNNARNATETYLKKYRTLDSEVLVDLENVIEKENLTETQKDKYRDILKKQYKDLSFEILEEEYDDEVSYVTVKIEVYDLYKAQDNANHYLEEHHEEFNDENGNYDVSKYMDYKLDKMKDTTDRVEYTLIFTVTKENDKYVVEQPTEDDLMKIHGVYNYDLN